MLPGLNGALAFGLSSNGYVAGSSMLNQGSGTPFFWSSSTGMVPIPLATGRARARQMQSTLPARLWVPMVVCSPFRFSGMELRPTGCRI